jgi:hypothetical protein
LYTGVPSEIGDFETFDGKIKLNWYGW